MWAPLWKLPFKYDLMKSTNHTLHKATLKSNCPDCYATNSLELSFTQSEKENNFYSKVSKELQERLFCTNCNQVIYPVKWTKDIELVHEYHKKQVQPKSASIRLKPMLYLIILFDALLVGALIYYFT